MTYNMKKEEEKKRFLRFIKEHDDILKFKKRVDNYVLEFSGFLLNGNKHIINRFFDTYSVISIVSWFYNNDPQTKVDCVNFVRNIKKNQNGL